MNRVIATEDLWNLSDEALWALWEETEIRFHTLPYGSWERCAAYTSLENIGAALAARRISPCRYAQISA